MRCTAASRRRSGCRSSRTSPSSGTRRCTRGTSSASAGVDIVLYCCSAYRAMNAAALATYEAIRRDGTQKNVLDRMQSRADLYKYLDYHAYEAKLDELFARGEREMSETQAPAEHVADGTQAEEVRGPVRRSPPAIPRSARSGEAATTCTTAATTSSTSPRTANSRRSPTCWCTRSFRTGRELAAYKAKLKSLRVPPKAVLHRARAAAGIEPPDGRDAHRGVGARVPASPRPRAIPSRRRATSRIGCSPRSARCCATGITSPTARSASTSRRTMIRSARISCICCTGRALARRGCARCIPRSSCTPSTNSTPRLSPPG